MNGFFFLFREAWINLRRHGLMTVAAITTIAIVLGLLGAFLVTFYEMDTAAQHAVSDFEMRVFCRTTISKEDLDSLGDKIKTLPGVASVTFRSRADAWKEATQNSTIDVSGIPNLMPDTFVVKLADASRAAEDAATIRGWSKDIQEVALPESELNGVQRLTGFLRTVGIVSGAILLTGALVVVSNTIRVSVFTRRREIRIMQIVGATPWFIRLPLLLEGLIHGTVGGLIACAGLWFTGRYVGDLIQKTVPMLMPYGGAIDAFRFGLDLVAVGALIGAGGSLLSIRRYLKPY